MGHPQDYTRQPRRERLALDIGTRIGPYEILQFSGAGGMGQVYRARDTRLNRDVAGQDSA